MNQTRSEERHTRSLIKAVTWRITGSMDTFLVSFVLTGRLTLAGSIAGVEMFTKILLYYFHERAWAMIPYGQLRGSLGRRDRS